jgi:WD40 repeat protein
MVRLWNIGTGAPLQTLKGYTDLVYKILFSPDGKLLASTAFDKTVKLWDSGLGGA